jgi:hypothetical protein
MYSQKWELAGRSISKTLMIVLDKIDMFERARNMGSTAICSLLLFEFFMQAKLLGEFFEALAGVKSFAPPKAIWPWQNA